MGRKQTIIVFPHLNDCSGDISKQWYVEWKWRIPGEAKMRKERSYTGMGIGTPAEERYKIAKKVINDKTTWLKSGDYLQGSTRKVYADELLYRNEARMYGKARDRVVTSRTNLSEFLAMTKQKVNAKTFENYVSKMRIFNSFLEENKLNELNIKNITRQNIIEFSIYLSEQKLSKLTIKKYIQIIHSFFNFELDRNSIPFNPAENIPAMGTVVDYAAVPFQKDERIRLKESIEKIDPQLWLACEIQYYCAIRPGTELRLMKIGWIDFDRKKFRIPSPEAKNSRVELVDIPEFLFEKLLHLKVYNSDLYIFGKFGQPNTEAVGKNTLRNRFNRYRDDIGISKDRKFYSWKHTGAIQLLDNGVQPHDLQGHLRHKSFTTTEVYIKKRAGNIENKVSRFSSEI